MGRHREPRKRPGPDVIGHQLTELRARDPRTATAVAVAEVAATAAPPLAARLRVAAAALAVRTPHLEPLVCGALLLGCTEHPEGFVRIRAPKPSGRETEAPAGAANAFRSSS